MNHIQMKNEMVDEILIEIGNIFYEQEDYIKFIETLTDFASRNQENSYAVRYSEELLDDVNDYADKISYFRCEGEQICQTSQEIINTETNEKFDYDALFKNFYYEIPTEDPEPYREFKSELHPHQTEFLLVGGGKKKKFGKAKPKRKMMNQGIVTVPVKDNAYAPLGLINTLKYNDGFTLKTNAGNQSLYYRMRMNDVFDPNPLIFSGAISGYLEIAALYRRYLVLGIDITIDFINNETFPVIVCLAPSEIDLATVIISAPTVLNLSEYPLAKRVILSERGGMNRAKVRFRLNLATFVGQAQAYRDSLTYSALNNAGPAQVIFFNIGMASADGSNFTALGVSQLATYKYRVKWSQRQTPHG
jgi:hypothetical protein